MLADHLWKKHGSITVKLETVTAGSMEALEAPVEQHSPEQKLISFIT